MDDKKDKRSERKIKEPAKQGKIPKKVIKAAVKKVTEEREAKAAKKKAAPKKKAVAKKKKVAKKKAVKKAAPKKKKVAKKKAVKKTIKKAVIWPVAEVPEALKVKHKEDHKSRMIGIAIFVIAICGIIAAALLK